MKRKINVDKITTKEDIEKIIENAFKERWFIDDVEALVLKIMEKYPDREEVERIFLKILKNYPTNIKMELKFEQMIMKYDDIARQYRDEILTKMDQIIGELAQMREDREFDKHDQREFQRQLADHEKRITKLERQKN